MTVTSDLSTYFTNLKFEDLPKQVVEEGKLCILDSLGCILAGAGTKEITDLLESLMSDNENASSSILGHRAQLSTYNALLVNGSMAHAVEMDDVHKKAKSHAGAVVVPAALTLSEKLQSSGKNLISSVVNGYEIMLRLGRAINATEHRLQGWHATGTCGTFGAAAAIATLQGFSESELVNALGLAGTQSSGLWAFTANGANSKMFHTGAAGLSGYLANLLVKGGITGSDEIIEAKDGGLFHATSKNYSYKEVNRNLSKEFLITDITRKPYACCRSMHPAIEAAIRIREHIKNYNSIKDIAVYTYEVAKIQCGYINTPKNKADAKFSIPYGIAVALIDGEALTAQFSEERLSDEQLSYITEKVSIYVDEKYNQAYPEHWGCRLEVTLSDGEILTVEIKNAKGDPTRPLTKQEIEEKFISLSAGRIGMNKSLKIINIIEQLEEYDDLGTLFSACQSENNT